MLKPFSKWCVLFPVSDYQPLLKRSMDTIQPRFTQHRRPLEVSVDHAEYLTLHYNPVTDRALFDVCDLNGRIMVTGEIREAHTKVEIADLYPDQYIVLVLDGDKVCSTKFSIDDYPA